VNTCGKVRKLQSYHVLQVHSIENILVVNSIENNMLRHLFNLHPVGQEQTNEASNRYHPGGRANEGFHCFGKSWFGLKVYIIQAANTDSSCIENKDKNISAIYNRVTGV